MRASFPMHEVPNRPVSLWRPHKPMMLKPAATGRQPFPLPGGEGQGEGESSFHIAMNSSISRRSFLLSTTTAAAGLVCMPIHGAEHRRKKIAFIGTEVRNLSHAQHFLDRLAMGYAWAGVWRPPAVDIASLYIDQFPENDLARSRAQRYSLKIYPTIAEALTLGTS